MHVCMYIYIGYTHVHIGIYLYTCINACDTWLDSPSAMRGRRRIHLEAPFETPSPVPSRDLDASGSSSSRAYPARHERHSICSQANRTCILHQDFRRALKILPKGRHMSILNMTLLFIILPVAHIGIVFKQLRYRSLCCGSDYTTVRVRLQMSLHFGNSNLVQLLHNVNLFLAGFVYAIRAYQRRTKAIQ